MRSPGRAADDRENTSLKNMKKHSGKNEGLAQLVRELFRM